MRSIKRAWGNKEQRSLAKIKSYIIPKEITPNY